MIKKTHALMAFGAAGMLVAGASQAALMNYSTDFNASDGFTEGATLDEVDGWNGRATQTTVNVATDGYTALGNGPAFTQRDSGGSWSVGDVIVLTADVFYDNNTTRSRFRLGLTDLTNDTAGAPKAGFEFDARSGGDIWAFGGGINEDTSLDLTTGQANGETYSVQLTKSSTANEIDVEVSFRGGAYTNSFTLTDATMYGAANVYGHIQANGGTNASVDAYSQTLVPEPSALLLAGFGGLVALGRRSRRDA